MPAPPFTFQGYDPSLAAITHRGYLPHMRQDGVIYFVTFRLDDSLPQEPARLWAQERDQWLLHHPPPHTLVQERILKSLWIMKVENALDQSLGSCVLRKAAIRNSLEHTLRHDDGRSYLLGEFVIMPNHVHILVRPELGVELSDLLQAWKSISAHHANAILDRSGTLWQEEYFDHILRDIANWQKADQYIAENPCRLPPEAYTLGVGHLGTAQTYLAHLK
jgi:putative transposase